MSNTTVSLGDRIYYAIIDVVMVILLIVIVYPIIFIVSSSFSSTDAIGSGKVFLFPVDFTLKGYEAVFKTSDFVIGLRNTVFYTIVGTILNVFMTLICAYPLTRRELAGKKWLMLYFSFTMIFSGGLIPYYLLISNLKLINTPWVMIIPGALSIYNMIITRTFIQNSIPYELLEAAKIDGCSDFKYFGSILVPLSKPVIAVIALYYAVDHWNEYFSAFLFISDERLYPLQIVLRNILLLNQADSRMLIDHTNMNEIMLKQGMTELLKYSLIVVSTLPVMLFYPFVQKHFIKGVMIGSIKC